ncbi:hypothetical protein BDFB_013886 [Asbolus verrucosus]|uniref:Uncharacterized protein n=1 Tax=Asbolus verrucosus TaxID=1661398 RepID=A0A482VYB1_ASBVE|nr:hypothetical protein BDFB_013886 [Asbolus verrucosus]
MKHSPRGYKLLQKHFALPSRKILMALLRKVPFGCGVNKSVLHSLEKSVSTLSDHDKHCKTVWTA